MSSQHYSEAAVAFFCFSILIVTKKKNQDYFLLLMEVFYAMIYFYYSVSHSSCASFDIFLPACDVRLWCAIS